MNVEIRTMTAHDGTRFERALFTCPMGHDLGSIPLDMLREHPAKIRECVHYEHRRTA